jgi:hypothetical protein
VGVLLGDGHIVRISSTGNSRLVYVQTAIAHKKYFDCVYSFFIPFCAKDYILQSRLIRDNRTKKYIVLYLSQLCNFSVLMNLDKCFNEFREMFYLLNVKRVPCNVYELSTPFG